MENIVETVEYLIRDNIGNYAGDTFVELFKSFSDYTDIVDDKLAISELNRFWRRQLARISKVTVSERSCLSDTISKELWLKSFESTVMPTIKQYNLPI